MAAGIFDDARMVSTVLRVRDVAVSVGWYREKLGLEPIYVDVGEIRRSAENEFVWFHDLDGNRFELSRPLGRP